LKVSVNTGIFPHVPNPIQMYNYTRDVSPGSQIKN